MKNCESLKEMKEWLEYDFNVVGRRDFNNLRQLTAYLMNEYDYLMKEDETEKNCFIVLLGTMIANGDSVIHEFQYNLTVRAVEKIMKEYENFDLTQGEKKEILQIACELKERLVSMKIVVS
ncbi:MAG: hypothetical protein IJN11_01610 [Oscillospiraceae bacterium]|nr:hypothetical protein [Oscillospiraceae bacterium]